MKIKHQSQRDPQYVEARKKAYPSIEEQLDTLYHEGYEGWKKTIDEVKQAHPK